MKQTVLISKHQELSDRLMEYLEWIYPECRIEVFSKEEERSEAAPSLTDPVPT